MTQVFTGSGRHFQELQAVSLDQENLLEIVQRIKLQPRFLGEPLIVIADGANFSLPPLPDIYELVALDVLGRSVVISIVIGTASPERRIESRAQELAAQVSSHNAEELGKIAREFLSQPNNDALRRVWEEGGVEVSDEAVELASLLAVTFQRDAGDYSAQINSAQRIVIAAEAFTQRVVNLVNWLASSGVSVKGVRFQKYLVGGQEIFFAEQAVPKVEPAVDSRESSANRGEKELVEQWKAKGLAYYLEQLTPALGTMLERIVIGVREETFSLNWAHKYYFWLRGTKRTLRVRAYHRDRLELGFYNHSPEAVADFLASFRLPGIDVYTVGGYAESPFIALSTGMELSDEWLFMLKSWLAGKGAGV